MGKKLATFPLYLPTLHLQARFQEKQNTIICKWTSFTDNGFMKCSQANVVIPFIQLYVLNIQ